MRHASDPRWSHDESFHAWWVADRLLAGEYPGARSLQKTAMKVGLLLDAGIDSIVDLTTPADGLDPYRDAVDRAAAQAGRQVRHFAHPIPDMDVVDHDGYDRILARIRHEMAAGRVVYLHCWGGKGRTSTVVGCLLIDDGLDYQQAIERLAALRSGTRKAAVACPESESQHRLLQERARDRNLRRD